MKERNSNIEILRIIALFGILLWHITMHGFGYSDIAKTMPKCVYTNTIIAAIFVPCVNIFVLISGYFGIKLSVNSLLRLESQSLFYGWAKVIMFLIMGIPFAKGAIFPTISGDWWFLKCYVLLMFASPVLNLGIKQLKDRQLCYVIIGYILINGVGSIFRKEINGFNFTSLFLVYIIGTYLRRLKESGKLTFLKHKEMLFVGLCIIVNFFVLFLLIHTKHTDIVMVYLSYSNPLIIVYSIIVFVSFLNMEVRNIHFINTVARHTFATYLLTDYFIGPLFLYKMLSDTFIKNFGLGLLLTILVYCIGILIDYIRALLLSPLVEILATKVNSIRWNRNASN